MKKPTLKQIEYVLKTKYGLAVGEISLRKIQGEIFCLLQKKIIVIGRSYATGRQNTAVFHLSDFLSE
ncbi:MAG: hypothetical protein NC923_02275 [Candidatus Omnitrophica bacterium]|nr:hypothetical protein [Candidatus Omnitrophota bacterium]